MRKQTMILIFIFAGIAFSQDASRFDQFFIDKTMRLDYNHSGIYNQDVYSYDEIYQESIWPGSLVNLIDTLNLGKYRFNVYDVKTNELIYSRGFCSIFGEWQTTQEAQDSVWRSFGESIRFPWPKGEVQVTIFSRNRYNVFETQWSMTIDPTRPNIRKGSYYADVHVKPIFKNGDPHKKVDIVILPDGYTRKEMIKFIHDSKRLTNLLFETVLFNTHKEDFNVWAIEIPSNESGIDNPQHGLYVDNVLSCSYNAFGSDRYILTWDNKTLRKIAAKAPYDQIYILVNAEKYGGGGIFNLYSTCISNNLFSDYIFVHEFGHAFGGLADEYYTSETAYAEFYPQGVEPWEPNITALLDKEHFKWKSLIAPDIMIPTPWNKYTYDNQQIKFQKVRKEMRLQKLAEDTICSVMAQNDHWAHEYLQKQETYGKVGAFEGAGYVSKGLYRPFLDCRMFTRGLTGFCPVCSRAIERMIDFYSQ